MAPKSLRGTRDVPQLARIRWRHRRDVAPAQDRVLLPVRRLPPVRDGGDADLATVPAGPRGPRPGRGATGNAAGDRRRLHRHLQRGRRRAGHARGRSSPGAHRRGGPEHRPVRHRCVGGVPDDGRGAGARRRCVRAVLSLRPGQHRPHVRGGTRSGHRQLRPGLLDRPRHRRSRGRCRRGQLAMGLLLLGGGRRRPGGVGAAMDGGRSRHRAARAVPPAPGVRAAARVPDVRARDHHRPGHALRGHRVRAGALRRPGRLAHARQPAARGRPAGLDPRQGGERYAL